MEKAIVTGATGFIGFALVKRLVESGIKVYAVVREQSREISKLIQLPDVTVIGCNLADMEELPAKIQERQIDCFYHLAWQGVANEDSQNLEVQLANVKYSCDAVFAANELKCKRFVFPSSIMEYEVAKLMKTELNAQRRNIYRTAKIAATYMTRIEANNANILYNSAIISNVYGVGEISNRFINTTLRKFIRGEHASFTAAQQMYDFIYIEDAVRMLQLIGEKGVANRSYYIGNEKPRKLIEFIYEMRDCVDTQIKLGIGESKEYVGVSLDYTEVDTGTCYTDFQFQNEYSFTDGIKKTIEWIRSTEVDENSKHSNTDV